MKLIKIVEGRSCPQCGSTQNQINAGKNRSGTQRCKCKTCNKFYTLEPKIRAISEEKRELAIRTYYSGVSARGVGKIFDMNKSNVTRWIKKTE